MEPLVDAPEQSEEEVTQGKASRVPLSEVGDEDEAMEEPEAMEDEERTEGRHRGDNDDPEDDAETEEQPEPSEGNCITHLVTFLLQLILILLGLGSSNGFAGSKVDQSAIVSTP